MWKHTIQGTQNLVAENCSHNLCICYLYSMARDTFSGSLTLYLTSIQWSPYKQSKSDWPLTKIVDKYVFTSHDGDRFSKDELMYCTCWNSTHTIAERDKLIKIFIHYLAARNNNCSRFRSLWEQTSFSFLIMKFYLLVNYWQTPAQASRVTCLGAEGVPWIDVPLY